MIIDSISFFTDGMKIDRWLFDVANEFYLIIGVMGSGRHWWGGEGERRTADGSAERITEVTEEDSAIINMPSAGSHKSRVIEFSTSITGRRLARPQEIGRNGTYLERELDDSIPLLKDAVLFDFFSFAFSLSLSLFLSSLSFLATR